jgi:hypothetical protein
MGKDHMMYRVIFTWFQNYFFECISYLLYFITLVYIL